MTRTLQGRSFKRTLALALAAAVAATGLLATAQADARPVPVKTMTRNIYLGADLFPLIAAPNAPAAYRAAGTIWDQMHDTNFPARAKLLAQEIANTRPDLIGLQEVALWRRGQINAPDGPNTPATEEVQDFLQLLRHQLELRGLNYRVVSVQQEADLEAPVDRTDDATANPTFDARLTMRDVILAKVSRRMRITGEESENFEAAVTVPTAVGNIPVLRGYNAVDVRKKRGRTVKRFRFINTHLEAFHAYFRNVQARELVITGGPADTPKPVILVGDLNSDPTNNSPQPPPTPGPALQSDAYNTILNAGTFSSGPGFVDRGVTVDTCCHDADLRNDPPAPFDERIDHIMTRRNVSGVSASLLGANPALRTPTGLWPSDHGGVFAALRVN